MNMKNNTDLTNINYKEFDTLTIYAKKDRLDSIIDHYKIFGWEIVCQNENTRYEDIVDITFSRPHKIKNKDELQLYQVYMEDKLNELAKVELNKHSKSLSVGLSIGVISLAIIILGIFGILNITNNTGLIFEIILISIGAIAVIILTILLPVLVKKEKILFKQKRKELEEQLTQIYKKAVMLSGDKYE